MHPDEDQLGDYKSAMESLRDADSCDSCGKKIIPGTGYSVPTKTKGGHLNFHKDANACADAPEVRKRGDLGVRHIPNYKAASANNFSIEGDGRA